MKKLEYTFGIDTFVLAKYWLAYPDVEDYSNLWDMIASFRKYDNDIVTHILDLAKLYSIQRDVIYYLDDLVKGIKWCYDTFSHKIDLPKGYIETNLYWDLSGLNIRIELYSEEEKND